MITFFLGLVIGLMTLEKDPEAKTIFTKKNFTTLTTFLFKSVLIISFVGLFIMFVDFYFNFLLITAENSGRKLTWSFFDWIIITRSINTDFHKGFNFSFFFSILIALAFLNILNKKNKQLGCIIILKFLIITAVLGFSFFVSIYSVVNLVYNLFAFNNFKLWFKTEYATGLLLLRVTSIIILLGVIKFIFNHVFNTKIILRSFSILTVKFDSSKSGLRGLDEREYSSIYFAQMGFYAIVFSILFYAFRIKDSSIVAHALNFVLFYIIDDWAIIYNYTYKLNRVNPRDNLKIHIFNLVLLILGGITVYRNLSIVYFFGYLFFVSILILLRFSNEAKLEEI